MTRAQFSQRISCGGLGGTQRWTRRGNVFLLLCPAGGRGEGDSGRGGPERGDSWKGCRARKRFPIIFQLSGGVMAVSEGQGGTGSLGDLEAWLPVQSHPVRPAARPLGARSYFLLSPRAPGVGYLAHPSEPIGRQTLRSSLLSRNSEIGLVQRANASSLPSCSPHGVPGI